MTGVTAELRAQRQQHAHSFLTAWKKRDNLNKLLLEQAAEKPRQEGNCTTP